jgi:hypothetical protein
MLFIYTTEYLTMHPSHSLLDAMVSYDLFIDAQQFSKKAAKTLTPVHHVVLTDGATTFSPRVLLKLLEEAKGVPVIFAVISNTGYVILHEFTDALQSLQLTNANVTRDGPQQLSKRKQKLQMKQQREEERQRCLKQKAEAKARQVALSRQHRPQHRDEAAGKEQLAQSGEEQAAERQQEQMCEDASEDGEDEEVEEDGDEGEDEGGDDVIPVEARQSDDGHDDIIEL